MAEMPDTDEGGDVSMLSAAVELTVRGQPLRLEMAIPRALVRPSDLLPLFRWAAESLMDISVRRAERDGKQISCRKGCGACCRQLVPIAPAEAHALAELVESLPEPRRQTVRSRFAAAWERLQSENILEELLRLESLTGRQRQQLGIRYFQLQVACPFLEAEACSIYEDRPIACREYLVTSPTEDCAKPTAQAVRVVRPPGGAAWRAVAALGKSATSRAGVVPLILAPQFAAAHDEDQNMCAGPKMVQAFFAALSGEAAADEDPPPV